MNKVILMETGETPSLGPSCCFARLILLFALHLANLYEVPLPKCEGTKAYKPCLSFFISFSLFHVSRSLYRLSLSSLTSSTPQHSQSAHATYETLNTMSISYFIVLTVRTRDVRDHDKTWMACHPYFIVLTVRTRDVRDHDKTWMACQPYFIVLTVRTRDVRDHDKTWMACHPYFIVLTIRTRDVWDHDKTLMACQPYFIVLTVCIRDLRNHDRLQPVWGSLRLAPNIIAANLPYIIIAID